MLHLFFCILFEFISGSLVEIGLVIKLLLFLNDIGHLNLPIIVNTLCLWIYEWPDIIQVLIDLIDVLIVYQVHYIPLVHFIQLCFQSFGLHVFSELRLVNFLVVSVRAFHIILFYQSYCIFKNLLFLLRGVGAYRYTLTSVF